MTCLLHVQLCREQRQTTLVSLSSTTLLLLPPLRLLATPATTSASEAASSPFLHALTTAPFWLDIALSYLLPHDWLLLEALSHALGHHVKHAEAWCDVDLGPAFLPSLPPSLTPAQIIQRIRREVIERQVSLRRMHKAWTNLKKFAPPGVVWTLNSKLEEGVVRRLETKMGCVLPPDLRASFLIHDGQGFLANPGMMVGGGRLLSLSEVVLEACRQDKEEGEGGKEGGEEEEGVPRLLASPALRVGEEGVEGGRARMVPVSEGARGRSVCVALPKRRRRGGEEGEEEEEQGEVEGVGCVYMVTALSCRRLASSWGEYLGSLR
jgi:hypothetical protein